MFVRSDTILSGYITYQDVCAIDKDGNRLTDEHRKHLADNFNKAYKMFANFNEAMKGQSIGDACTAVCMAMISVIMEASGDDRTVEESRMIAVDFINRFSQVVNHGSLVIPDNYRSFN